MFSAILSSLLLIASTASALEYDPVITSPEAGDVWYKGVSRAARVKWDASLVPAKLLDHSDGTFVKLGYRDGNDTIEHMNITLATNFRLGDGVVVFPLPNSMPTCKRCIVAIGDSGNLSPEFEIRPRTPGHDF